MYFYQFIISRCRVVLKKTKALMTSGLSRSGSGSGKWKMSDEEMLEKARKMGRYALTHDPDLGTLIILMREPSAGIIDLRPGGRRPNPMQLMRI